MAMNRPILEGCKKDGSLFPVEVNLTTVATEAGVMTIAAVRDISERRQIEGQLRQAQKMEAVGQLTGGLAHDFNNLLGVITVNLDLLTQEITDPSAVAEHAEEALEAALLGADLTRRLLAFACKQVLRPVILDVNALIQESAKLLRRTLGEQNEIELRLDSSLRLVSVDPAQLEAALLNLATNARDAMPKGGRLTVATYMGELDKNDLSEEPQGLLDAYVVIEMSDSGTGIEPRIMARIFEPFFSTKDTGKGSGLGLSMVFGFMRQSGGHVAVTSAPEKGTTFRLYLPPSEGTTVKPAEIAVADKTTSDPRGKTILLVEDNVMMSNMVQKTLRRAGYDVIAAENAHAALAIIDQDQALDLMFTDVVMPGGMDGVDLACEAVIRRPGLKILLTSGFPESLVEEGRNVSLAWKLLAKPYRLADMIREISTLMDGPGD
jgi:signal transduction histidine kinase